jgi:hypothetical protein
MIRIRYAGLILLIMMAILFLVPGVNAATGSGVDIVEIGMLSHGPMQPTVSAVNEVLSNYGDQIHMTKYDLTTAEGAQYAKDHGITQHFSIFINGKDHFMVGGKDVTFEMFEGQQWTKQDLDTVIAAELGLPGGNSSVTSLPAQNSTKPAPLKPITIVLALGLLGLAVLSRGRGRE